MLALVTAGLAFFVWGGQPSADLISWGARKYLSGFRYLSVEFDGLSGDLSEGYKLSGLNVGSKENTKTVSVRRISFSIDPGATWAAKKLVLSAAVDGLRINERELPLLQNAAQKEFPPSDSVEEENGGLGALNLIVPHIELNDWRGTLPWLLEKLVLDRPQPDQLTYTLDLRGKYRDDPAELSAEAALSPDALPEHLFARIQGLGNDLTAKAYFEDGRINLKSLEGTLFSAAVKGSAQVDTASSDLPLKAELLLKNADFSPLRRWLPDLGPCGFEELNVRCSGSVAHPQGTVVLKNARAAWQQYTADTISGSVALKEDKAVIDVSARCLDAAVSASGSVGLNGAMPLALKANLSPLALKNLVSFVPSLADVALDGTLSAEADVSGTVSSPSVALTVSAPRVSALGQYAASDILLKAAANPKEMNIQQFSARAFGGTAQAQGRVSVAGTKPAFNINGTLQHIDLAEVVPGGSVQGTLNSSVTLTGTADKPHVEADSSIDMIDAGQFGAKSINLTVKGSNVLNVNLAALTKSGTPFGGGGTVTLPLGNRASSLDLRFNLDEMKLSELLPNTMKYSGALTAELDVKGSFDKPDVRAKVRGKEIQVNGFPISDPLLDASLRGTRVDVDASISMGDRRPSVRGFVDFTKGLNAVFDAVAQDVRVDAISPALSGTVDGRVSLKASAKLSDSGISAEGAVTSPLISAAGVRVERINIPFQVKGITLQVPDGTFVLGGSTLHLNAGGDASTSAGTFTLNGDNIDLHKLTAPLGLPAEIAGSVSVQFDGEARSGVATILQGDGRLRFHDISVDKFPGQFTVTGKSPFKVQRGNIFFNVNDGDVYIMPGSAINAWPDDTLYHFVAFTGLAWRQAHTPPKLDPSLMPDDLAKNSSDMYHILVNGSVNARVINSLLGGLGAVLEAGASGNVSKEEIASDVVKKLITGAIFTQMRDFDLDVAGKDYGEVRVNKLKFGGEGSYADVATTDWTEDSSQRKDEQRYSFSYPLPVGPDPSKIKPKGKAKD